jgi:hypothetical protein
LPDADWAEIVKEEPGTRMYEGRNGEILCDAVWGFLSYDEEDGE